MLFFPGWSTLLAGFLIPYKTQIYLPFNTIHQINFFHLSVVLVLFAMVMGSTFILNQLADKKSDKINSKLFLISHNHISTKNAIIEVIILIVLSMVFGYLLDIKLFIIFTLFFILTGYLYNFKPFEFKNKPWPSLFANALMGWFAFAIGWSMHSNFDIGFVIISMPYLLFNTALYLFTTLPDVSGDRETKKETFAVLYGQKTVILSAFSYWVMAILRIFFGKYPSSEESR